MIPSIWLERTDATGRTYRAVGKSSSARKRGAIPEAGAPYRNRQRTFNMITHRRQLAVDKNKP